MAVGKIQRTPQGLLQFLGMVGTGVPPTLMADEVRAHFDMLPFYGSPTFRSVGVSVVGAVLNTLATATVPNGENWILYGGAQMTFGPVAAAEQVRTAFRILTKDANRIRVHSSELVTAVAANATLSTGFTWPQPILLTPGEGIEARVDDVNAAAGRDLGCFSTAFVIAT